MTSSRHRVPAIEIEIALAITRIDPHPFAALSDDRHLLVGRKLELLFEFGYFVQVGRRIHFILLCFRSALFSQVLPMLV